MRFGVIGRFKPLHNGGAVMLEELCRQADHVIIGIGSSKNSSSSDCKYNVRNPFTAEESEGMVRAYLGEGNYTIVHIPDFAHIPEYRDGRKWHDYVFETFGPLDRFVTGNQYVADLLSDVYDVVHPAQLIPVERHVRLCASQVRMRMARYEDWKSLVPQQVAEYLESNGLVTRFRKEFGLQTLAAAVEMSNFSGNETHEEEYLHTLEN